MKRKAKIEQDQGIEQPDDGEGKGVPIAIVPADYRDKLNSGKLSASYLVNLVQAAGWPIHPNVHILVVSGGAYFDRSRNIRINLYPLDDWEFNHRCRTPLMVGKNEDETILAVRLPLFTNRNDETVPLELVDDRGL